METITNEDENKDERNVSKTIFVFNLKEPSRSEWHRHFTFRCKRCNTYLVIACDKTINYLECLGPPKQHSILDIPSYKQSSIRDVPIHLKEPIKRFKWNDCDEHFTR